MNNNNGSDEANRKNSNRLDQGSESQKEVDLENLLKPLRDAQASSLQVAQWKAATKTEVQKKSKHLQANQWVPMQLVAALLIGFILGALLFKNSHTTAPNMEWVNNMEANATFERVHTNLD